MADRDTVCVVHSLLGRCFCSAPLFPKYVYTDTRSLLKRRHESEKLCRFHKYKDFLSVFLRTLEKERDTKGNEKREEETY